MAWLSSKTSCLSYCGSFIDLLSSLELNDCMSWDIWLNIWFFSCVCTDYSWSFFYKAWLSFSNWLSLVLKIIVCSFFSWTSSTFSFLYLLKILRNWFLSFSNALSFLAKRAWSFSISLAYSKFSFVSFSIFFLFLVAVEFGLEMLM